jgi:hypothetical protein
MTRLREQARAFLDDSRAKREDPTEVEQKARMSPNPMAELTDKGGARFGSGGFQRKSPAEAGL